MWWHMQTDQPTNQSGTCKLESADATANEKKGSSGEKEEREDGGGGHPGGRRPSDLQAEPSLSPAACNPSQGPRLRGGGRGRASLLQVNPFPECRTMKNQKKEKMSLQDKGLSLEPAWILGGRG